MNVLKYTNNKMHSQLQIMILLHPPPRPSTPGENNEIYKIANYIYYCI